MTDLVEVSTTIAAPPESVYALVADLSRMGEWSPETTGVTWLGGAQEPRPGAVPGRQPKRRAPVEHHLHRRERRAGT